MPNLIKFEGQKLPCRKEWVKLVRNSISIRVLEQKFET